MALLSVYKRPVENVFDLLGQSEDGMTYALGWVLSQVPTFKEKFCSKVRLEGKPEKITIDLQKSRSGFGRTDIELMSPNKGTVVIEAKRGFVFPTVEQLSQYINGLSAESDPPISIIVLTQFPEAMAYQSSRLPDEIKSVPIKFISWQSILVLAKRSIEKVRGTQKSTLMDFIVYLRKVISLTDKQSNMVYVVALSGNCFLKGQTTFIEVVEKHQKYFHPFGNGYPTTPPNYIGFRYNGRLQSIHHIKDYSITASLKKTFPDLVDDIEEPHFLYELGPAIRPPHTVKSGQIYNARYNCMLDTLLTCRSIKEAYQETQTRLGDGE